MGAAILIAAGVALWAWKQGKLRALRYGDVAAAVAALVAVNAFRHGQAGLGLVGLATAGAWLWWRRRAPAAPGGADEARRLLDVGADASPAEIRAAHRRLIARVHPDTGGSAELARRVNAARDLLLDELNPAPLRAS